FSRDWSSDVCSSDLVNTGGAAEGSVTSDKGGIDCGATCEGTVTQGTEVVLTATATAGGFAGWTGGACDNVKSTTCTFTASEGQEIGRAPRREGGWRR